MANKCLILVLLVSLLAFIPGCWDNTEITRQAIVAGIGVDKGERDRLRVTVQIIVPAAMGRPVGGQGGGQGGMPAVFVVSAEARTIHEALSLVAKQTDRMLFFAHKEIVVVGEELAREDLTPVVDWAGRARGVRLKDWLVVTSATAREVLELPPTGIGNISALIIADNIELSFQHSKVPRVRVFDFASALTWETRDPVAVALHLTGDEPPRPNVSGSAVFRDFRLAGYLTETETRGYLWTTGDIKRGFISAPLPEANDKFIALQIRGSRTKVRPEFRDGVPGIPVIKIDISVKCALDEVQDPGLEPDKPWVIDELEPLMAEQVVMEVQAAVAKAQQLNADVFGFGDLIKRKNPEVWKELRDRWELIFPLLEVEVAVKPIIRRTELFTTPIRRPGS
jgi:spore germination protein KC